MAHRDRIARIGTLVLLLSALFASIRALAGTGVKETVAETLDDVAYCAERSVQELVWEAYRVRF